MTSNGNWQVKSCAIDKRHDSQQREYETATLYQHILCGVIRAARFAAAIFVASNVCLASRAHAGVDVISQSVVIEGSAELPVPSTIENFSFSDNTLFNLIDETGTGAVPNASFDVTYSVQVDRQPTAVVINGDLTMSGSALSGLDVDPFTSCIVNLEIRFQVTESPVTFSIDRTSNSIITGLPSELLASGSTGDAGDLFKEGANNTSLFQNFCDNLDGTLGCGLHEVQQDITLQPGTYRLRFNESISAIPSVDAQPVTASLASNWVVTVGVPDTCELTWKIEDGNMGDATSWEPERVPENDNAGCDNLIFDRTGIYSVGMGTLATNSMTVKNGVPIFNGTQLTLSGNGGINALQIGDSGGLALNSGTINLPSGSQIIVGSSGSIDQTLSTLLVQEQGTTINQAAGGTTRVGGVQAGSMSVLAGAQVSLGTLVAGGGKTGRIDVFGGVGGARSTLAVADEATIGDAGPGELLVRDGALFGVLGDFFVGFTSSGLATVSGLDSGGNPATITANNVSVGGNEDGLANITIQEGGLLEGRGLFVGSGVGDGNLLLLGQTDGVNGNGDARGLFTGNTLVGGTSTGLIRLEGDAELQTGTLNGGNSFRIASDGAGSGTVELTGLVDVAPRLLIRGDLRVGLVGTGVLDITSGFVTATGEFEFERGNISIKSNIADNFRSNLVVDGFSAIDGPDDGAATTMSLVGGAKFEVKQDLLISNGRFSATGSITDSLVDPNTPLVDSAALLKALGTLTVGELEGDGQGNAQVRLVEGANADVGELLIRSGEVTVLTPETSTRPSAIESFTSITVGNSTNISSRIGTLRILGDSFVQAPDGLLVQATGRVFFTRGALFPKVTVQSGGRVDRVRSIAGKATGSSASFSGPFSLAAGAVLGIEADFGAEPTIKITGDAELLGELEVTFPNEAGLKAGDTFNLLQITGTKTGDFSAVRFPTRSNAFAGNFTVEDGKLVLTVTSPGESLVTESEPADINEDSSVDAVDVQLVINAALGLGITPGFEADVNADTDVDAVDIQIVINSALGL